MQANNVDATIGAIIIKLIKIAILTYYCNFKIINKKFEFNIRSNILIVIVGIISALMRYETNYLISTVFLIITISLIFSKNQIGNSILTTSILLSINSAVEVIAITMCFFIEMLININNDYAELFIIAIIHIIIYTEVVFHA